MSNKLDIACRKKFKDNKCCVIIPTYNNQSTIIKVVEDVKDYCGDIFVVSDGCTDDTLNLLKHYEEKELQASSNVEVLAYSKNVGKGYAIRYAFKQAYENGFEYAVTIDADGQHYASDLSKFINELQACKNVTPNTIILGSRMLQDKGQKKSSSFANKFANFWFKLETGKTLNDTQSGYRLYPLKEIIHRKWYSNKYEFELEVLVRFVWREILIKEIDIDVYYPPEEERVTHFRPFKDFFRISVLNTILVILALFYYRPLLILKNFRKKSIKQIFREELSKKENSNFRLAASIGFGFFMGIFPVWGYQLLIGFTVAHFLKLNKMIFFITANISIVPMIPIILYSSLAVGAFLLGQKIDAFTTDITWGFVKQNLIQYIIGAIVLSSVMGILSMGISYVILKKTRK